MLKTDIWLQPDMGEIRVFGRSVFIEGPSSCTKLTCWGGFERYGMESAQGKYDDFLAACEIAEVLARHSGVGGYSVAEDGRVYPPSAKQKGDE